jgi:4-hydroxybutyrate CoA-transferase
MRMDVRWMTASAAIAEAAPDAVVLPGNACGTPIGLLGEVVRASADTPGRRLVAGLLVDPPALGPALRRGDLSLSSWHIAGEQRRLVREGLVDYLPGRLMDLPVTVMPSVDVALIRTTLPDRHGYVNAGPSVTYLDSIVESSARIIAEVSDLVPASFGMSRVPIDRLAALVETESPQPSYAPAPTDVVSEAIAARILEVLPHGATVQLGIGAVPEALARTLTDHVTELDLGLVGLVSEAMVDLVEAIVRRRRAPVEAVELMGTADFMEWARLNPAVEMRTSRHVHHPLALARTPRVVSVNSAVCVDLRGQVVAESVRGNVIAGIGGSNDFAEGAHLSPGGLRIIALRSTTKTDGSTIVVEHDPADTISLAYHSVDVVVTEHGVAWLRGRTVAERREALVSVAAPHHRADLAGTSAGDRPKEHST